MVLLSAPSSTRDRPKSDIFGSSEAVNKTATPMKQSNKHKLVDSKNYILRTEKSNEASHKQNQKTAHEQLPFRAAKSR